jgi:hypothetical protein
MKGCKIDFVKKTLTITKEFEDKMQDMNSAEYGYYNRVITEIPGIVVLRRTHKTPTKYVNKNNEKFYCNQFKNLKFERMEKFMSSLSRADEYMAEYNFLKYYAGVIQTNKYALVRKWFVAQFPEFRKNPLFYFHNEPEVLKAKEFADKEAENTELDDVA